MFARPFPPPPIAPPYSASDDAWLRYEEARRQHARRQAAAFVFEIVAVMLGFVVLAGFVVATW